MSTSANNIRMHIYEHRNISDEFYSQPGQFLLTASQSQYQLLLTILNYNDSKTQFFVRISDNSVKGIKFYYKL